jgi:hypothetical protein
VAADAYVAERRRSLAHLAMQHNVTNFLVEGSGDEVRCRCNYQILRFTAEPASASPGPAGGARAYFHSFGRYSFTLARARGAWRIQAIRQEPIASWGEPGLHPGAALPGPGR